MNQARTAPPYAHVVVDLFWKAVTRFEQLVERGFKSWSMIWRLVLIVVAIVIGLALVSGLYGDGPRNSDDNYNAP